jgi:hypothetical protein
MLVVPQRYTGNASHHDPFDSECAWLIKLSGGPAA